MKAYKLMRKMADGSLAPLFINKKQRLMGGVWYEAEDHKTKGYKHRPGWHACALPIAPHLSKIGRVWCEVDICRVREEIRPAHQGGKWYLANSLRVVRELSNEDVRDIIGEA